MPGDINNVMKDILSRLNANDPNESNVKNGSGPESGGKKIMITPSKALVLAGILTDTLEVFSILIDRNQTVEIVLAGSLKQKTELEKMLDQIGSMPFDEVLKAILGRLSL